MAREDLQITITAVDKATGTFKGLADTVGSVQKGVAGLQDTQRNLNWMFLGQDLLRAARTGITGLTGLAKASSDVVEAQNFVQQVFGDSTKSVVKFSQTATKSTLMSEKAILDAAATFGLFGKAAGLAGDDLSGFSTNLVQLAADMASIKNTTVDQAINAIGAAFRGQTRPIRQYGVLLDAATIKQKAFEMGIYNGNGALTQAQRVLATNQVLYDQLGFAVGDVNRTFDTMANQQRYLSAQFENFKAHVGSALVPMFTTVMDVANRALGAFEALPAPLQNTITRLGAVGVGAVGLAGGFIFMAAKVQQGVKAFQDMRGAMQGWAAAGGAGRETIAGIGKALTGLGAAAVATQLVFSTINDIRNVAGKTTDALEKMNIAIKKGSQQDAWSGFLDLAKQKDDALTFGHLITDFGKKIQLFGSDTKRPIEDLDAAFKQLLNQDPGNAAAVLDIMRKNIEAADQNASQTKDNIQLYNRWDAQLKQHTQSMQASGEETGLTADQLDQYGDAALSAGDSTDAFDKALADGTKQMQDWYEALRKADATIEPLANKVDDFGTAVEQSFGQPTAADNARDIADSVGSLIENLKDSDSAVRKGAEGLDLWNKTGRDQLGTLDELSNKIGKDVVRAYKDSGGSVDEARKTMEFWRDTVEGQMKAAGIAEPVIQAYLDKLGLTEGTWESTIKLAGQEEARRKLDELNIDYASLPPAIYTEVQALIDQGDYESAYAKMKGFLTQAVETPVDTTGEQQAANDAHATIEGTMSKPVTQPVKTSDTNSNDIKTGIINTFSPWVNQPIQTTNTDRFTTKAGFTSFFGSAINQVIDTLNTDKGGTKSNIKQTFDPAIQQEIKTYNTDASATKSKIGGIFGSAISQTITTIKNIITQPAPGGQSSSYVSGVAARPSAAEYAATSAPGVMATAGAIAPAPVTAGGYAPRSTAPIINLHVNMPVGTNEARVVSLLRSYARSNGRGALAS